MTMPNHKKCLPDMRLYGLIIFLQKWFYGKWIVENVVPYYEYLIKPSIILGRHPFWCNFYIPEKDFNINFMNYKDINIKDLCKIHQVDYDLIKDFNPKDWKKNDAKRRVLRNCVLLEIGKYILDQVGKYKQKTLI